LGSELLEVVAEDDDGDMIDAFRRVQAYTAAQRLLARSRCLLLFDECSDAFAESGAGALSPHIGRALRGGKGWFNQALERNPIPTFWVTNDLSTMDLALLRRFDIVVEMEVPPRAVRYKIARSCCGAMASLATLDLLADSEELAPAVLTRASSVMQALAQDPGAKPDDVTLIRLVNQTLRAQGHAEVRVQDPTRLPEIYAPSLVNADTDLAALAAGIRRAGVARLCLYGPAGTGKSAYARWLAQELGQPLHLRRASDLMSMWRAQTEKNIAKAFREAEQEGAVLLLDEVDGFLRDRRGAQRSWEVAEVNEMLTQMESFAGVLVATTNLLDGLDPASLRRLDKKVRFGYLSPEQAAELLRRHCCALRLEVPRHADIVRISQLATLTPGDFAAVVRQHAFSSFATVGTMLDALAAECSLKSGGRQAIGFTAH
jgi:SpoVK/Ycf46/Vps4 family AAA+-type ATPase